MFIDIHELELHPLDFREEIRPDVIDLGREVRQSSVLKTSGHADLVEEHRERHHKLQDIRLQGQLSTRIEVSCARCLEPVDQAVARQFDLLYRPQGSDARAEEISVTDADAEIGYYQGDGLELEEVLREQILLAVPLKTLCNEHCKGLCPHCGTNLNQGQCSCTTPLEDARWAPLTDLRKKLEG